MGRASAFLLAMFLLAGPAGRSRAADVCAYGASPTALPSANTAAIQAAIDEAYSGGGDDVLIQEAGTYSLAVQGNDPYWTGYNCCLRVKSNVRLIVASGVTLRLADGQHADGAPVNIITVGAFDNVYIGGGGRITGNAAGQTGWTGGYGQGCAQGCIVSVRTSGASTNFVLEDLTLDDYFSNPVNVNGFFGGRINGVRFENLGVDNVGEGPQVIASDNVIWRNLQITDSTNVMAGDASELASVNGFEVNGLFVSGSRTGPGASAIDIFGSSNGEVSNVFVHDWPAGVAVHHFPPVVEAHDITIRDVVVRQIGPKDAGLSISGDNTYNIDVTNFVADNCAQNGAQIGNTASPGPHGISISNSIFDNNTGPGMQVTNLRNLTLTGVQANFNASSGFAFTEGTGITDNTQLEGISLSGIAASNNGEYGILISDSGGPYVYSGRISNALLESNGKGPLLIGGAAQETAMVLDGITPGSGIGSVAGGGGGGGGCGIAAVPDRVEGPGTGVGSVVLAILLAILFRGCRRGRTS